MDVDIVIQAEDGSRQVRRLNARGVISVGRSPRSALYLESDLVSRQHILVDVYEQGLRVEDTSTNGTLAGATLLRRSAAEVPFGTPIVVGNYTLLFQPADESEPPSNPTVVSLEGDERAPTAAPRPAPMPTTPGATPEPPRAAPAPPRPSQGPPRPPPPPPRRSSDRAPPAQASAPPPAPPHAAPTASAPPAPRVPNFAAAPAVPAAAPAAAPPAPAPAAPPPAPAAPPPAAFAAPSNADADAETALRHDVLRLVAEQLDPSVLDPSRAADPALRLELVAALRQLVHGFEARLPARTDAEALANELADEAIGYGPLGHLLNDPLVEEVLVVDPLTVYVERYGRRERANARFTDDERLLAVLGRVLATAGVHLDGRSPFVEARLDGGVHVHAALPPLSARGPSLTLRKTARPSASFEQLVRAGALDEAIARFLSHAVAARKNILVSGGQGGGKTALLGTLADSFGPDERVVSVEDVGELGLDHQHLVTLVAPPDPQSHGWTPRALVHQALRMRPERVVLGACVGDEAFELLRAMHAGCDGSMTTINAHSPREAITRFEALVRSGSSAPAGASLRHDIASALHLVVQQTRYHDGSRKVSAVTEVTGVDLETGEIQLADIFRFERSGVDSAGRVLGAFRPTGHLPTFLQALVDQGLVPPGGPYL